MEYSEIIQRHIERLNKFFDDYSKKMNAQYEKLKDEALTFYDEHDDAKKSVAYLVIIIGSSHFMDLLFNTGVLS